MVQIPVTVQAGTNFDFPLGVGSNATITSITYTWQTQGGFPGVDYTPEAGSITLLPALCASPIVSISMGTKIEHLRLKSSLEVA
jgi:hypothetical protein